MPQEFTNIAHIKVTESAANTLTFAKLETGVSITQKVGWIIHKMEYYFHSISGSFLDTAGDIAVAALTVSNVWTDIDDQSNPAILDSCYVRRADFGTAAAAQFFIFPIVKDFSMLPGGGLLIPPNPVYGAAKCTGAASAGTVRLRLYYSPVDLKTEDFWQMLEMYRLITT